jgi:branched-chain amino acid transport system permease protein
MRLPRWPASWAWPLWAALLVVLPLVADTRHALGLLSQGGIACILCLSYWLLMGQGGLLSFGHAVYSGAGAYLAIHTLRLIEAGLWLPVSLLPLAGGAAAALLAAVFGWLATRQSPTAFAMITLALGELAWAVALMFPAVFGGEAGIAGDRTRGPLTGAWTLGPPVQMYALVAAYTLVSAICIHGFTRTTAGRLLNAVRDNATRVAFLGHDPATVRWLAFVVAGFFAGVAGGLAALLQEIVTPEVLGSQRSAAVLVFTFVGGVGSLWGALTGGVLMVLGSVLLPALTPAWLLYLGLLFLVMVRWAPGGVAGWLSGPPTAQPLPWRFRLGQGMALGLALAALGALVEMAYQLHLADTVGSQVRYLGLRLDSHAAGHWAGAGLLAAAAAGALAHLRGRAERQTA